MQRNARGKDPGSAEGARDKSLFQFVDRLQSPDIIFDPVEDVAVLQAATFRVWILSPRRIAGGDLLSS